MSKFLFLVGIISLLIAGYLVWLRYTPTRLAFDEISLPASTISGVVIPTSIEIEDLDIVLPVVAAELTDKKWPMSDRGVVYLSNTSIPGEVGNSVLYGHNWPNLLGKLVRILPGDAIDISFSDGSVKHFLVAYTTTVTPDETHILDKSTDTRITLYTCTGFLDSKRFVAVASSDP